MSYKGQCRRKCSLSSFALPQSQIGLKQSKLCRNLCSFRSLNLTRLSLKRGTGNGERGTGDGGRGTGHGERGTGNGERGTGNGERGTGNGERGTGNGERGTGNGERYICKGIFYFNFHLYVLPDFPL